MIKLIPNILTLLRIISIPLILIAIEKNLFSIATAIFIIAAITDFLDGFIARLYFATSKTGQLLDAFADKLLTLTIAWELFFLTHQISLTFMIIITTREITISTLRFLNANLRAVSSNNLAKWKTSCFYILLSIILISNIPIIVIQLPLIVRLLEIIILCLSIISFMNYILIIISNKDDSKN